MRNLLNSKWLFVFNTLPILILITMTFGQYHVIEPLLQDETLEIWKTFWYGIISIGGLHFLYTIYAASKKQRLTIVYSVVSFLIYFVFVYLVLSRESSLLPFDIPRWMVTQVIGINILAFLMPTLIHSLLITVLLLTPNPDDRNVGSDLAFAVLVPVCAYFLLTSSPWVSGVSMHVFTILFFTLMVLFLFFVVRFIYTLTQKKSSLIKEGEPALKFLFCIVFPITGLFVNKDMNVFGDFSDPWFFIIAAINGVLLMIPSPNQKLWRLLLYIGRCIMFIYTLYFTFVFLPTLPFGLFSVLFLVGFLTLTPLILAIIHTNELSRDFKYLSQCYSRRLLTVIGLIATLVIPIGVVINYHRDKNTLNEALEYVYAPDYNKDYDINSDALRRTVDNVNSFKKGSNGFGVFNGVPYLNSLYNWIVLDNLTLSDTKIHRIERIFFKDVEKKDLTSDWRTPNDSHVKLSNISSNSSYDEVNKQWTTWVDIELKNQSNLNRQEYKTVFNLPDGAFISDYYLYVGERKEMGILAEKKSAKWVYSNIIATNRDPGILHYLEGNKVSFRVFPFEGNQKRKTGFEIIHNEPLSFTIDDRKVILGDSSRKGQDVETKTGRYISSGLKKVLPKVERPHYYHFVFDKSSELTSEKLIAMKSLLDTPAMVSSSKISFVDTYVNTIPYKEWDQMMDTRNEEGGFFLDRAIKEILTQSYSQETYPKIVVLSDNIHNAVVSKDYSDLSFTYPDHPYIHHLNNGKLESYALDNVLGKKVEPKFRRVRVYEAENIDTQYLPDDDNPSIVVYRFGEDFEVKEKSFISGLDMHIDQRKHILNPNKGSKEWLQAVKNSFKSKIMTHETSYIALENEAQKRALLKKQKEILNSKKELDAGEEPVSMSEPSIWILLASVGLFALYRRRKKLAV